MKTNKVSTAKATAQKSPSHAFYQTLEQTINNMMDAQDNGTFSRFESELIGAYLLGSYSCALEHHDIVMEVASLVILRLKEKQIT